MASSCLTCLSAILDDLQLPEDLCPKTPDKAFEFFRLRSFKTLLGILRTFLLCVRKWGDDDDANLGAPVVRMKDYISKLGRVIHKFYLTSVEDGYRMELATYIPSDLGEEATSLQQEIKDLDSSSRLSSKSLVKKDDLMDIMDSLLESLRNTVYSKNILETFEEICGELEEKLTFLKSFICFVTLHGIEDGQLGPLLTCTKSIVVNAACNSVVWGLSLFMSPYNPTRDLLPKIIPVEPEVHRTCFQALIASKISRQP